MDEKKAREIKPCPFCGEKAYTQHRTVEVRHETESWYRVYCYEMECGVVGPERSTLDGAITAWNSRAKPDSAALAEAREEGARRMKEKIAGRASGFRPRELAIYREWIAALDPAAVAEEREERDE